MPGAKTGTSAPAQDAGSDEAVDAYYLNLRAPITCEVRESPYKRLEWHKIMNGAQQPLPRVPWDRRPRMLVEAECAAALATGAAS